MCCSETARGATLCWGDNSDGGLGVEDTALQRLSSADAVVLQLDFPIVQVTMGALHTCVVQNDNRLRCWGVNSDGQLGLDNNQTLGDIEQFSAIAPVDLGNGANGQPIHVLSAVAGAWHTCVLLDGDQVRCWGYNVDGQLGLGFASVPPGLAYVGGTPSTVPGLISPVALFQPAN